VEFFCRLFLAFLPLPPPCMLGQTTTQREDRIGESKTSVIAEGEGGY